ncbi:DUF885 domain-containing protein [Sphingomonas sanxanigenens]|uniref:Tat pathway signal protein n=1 Tax=Sphingomonas sanxanigenens DSM 19645 = NX02 TaxID=1123269 RepID=W0AIZ1_9SPHN|nr:DUF885 family protein [Sphingomonas sanxanigenens]AHE56273.1 hypothetical protein NX02_23285 [Sphingomonas sanxanigenens DSM 19645 = NX02]
MDRRHFLAAGTASVALSMVPGRVFAQPASGDAALNARFDQIFNDAVKRSPEIASSLGLDKGANAALKAKLSDATIEERVRELAETKKAIASVEAVDTKTLSPAAVLNREVILYSLRSQTIAPETFQLDSVIRPYRIFQQGGAYFSIPDFLNTAHTIATREDSDAYLSRLEAFATVLDQDSAVQKQEAARGFLAPGWSIDLTLGQMTGLRAQPYATCSMVKSLADRAAAKGIAGDWAARAASIVETKVYPALDRQIALMKALRPTTRPGDGDWRLPDGDAIYQAAIRQATTTDFTAEQVHQMGLQQVAEISAELDKILKSQGFTKGGIGERLAALNVDPAQLYPGTDAGKAALIASLNEGVKAMYARLPQAFATLPTQPLEVRAVPVEIQDGASNGYYHRAALDGSRPAIYFINLKDVGDWPKYSLPSLTYHEGVPGHHLQISIAQESKDIPTLRKVGFFSAYSEGWALYAEQLADELKAYANPLERAGYLQSFLFRAARLVVDTGIHTKRWDVARATDYLVTTTGFARPRCQREVERYCTQGGQALSYKIGHIAWTRARAKAQAALGPKFDLKAFHEILRQGAMPLTMLEAQVDAWIKAA